MVGEVKGNLVNFAAMELDVVDAAYLAQPLALEDVLELTDQFVFALGVILDAAHCLEMPLEWRAALGDDFAQDDLLVLRKRIHRSVQLVLLKIPDRHDDRLLWVDGW